MSHCRGRAGHGRPADTFGLACRAKYYEDQGYPVTSTARTISTRPRPFTASPRGKAGRRSTSSTTPRAPRNRRLLDEPWSRPGDYVLLRAMTDLVCASSACPDDIDPANGWDPTDIHVRVYRRRNFQSGDGLSHDPRRRTRLTKETAFHPRLSDLTRLHRVSRLLAAELFRQCRRDRGVLGLPRAPSSWTFRRCASSRCSAPTPRHSSSAR